MLESPEQIAQKAEHEANNISLGEVRSQPPGHCYGSAAMPIAELTRRIAFEYYLKEMFVNITYSHGVTVTFYVTWVLPVFQQHTSRNTKHFFLKYSITINPVFTANQSHIM